MTRIPVNPELLTWVRERAGLDTLALAGRVPKLNAWGAGERRPTLRQPDDSPARSGRQYASQLVAG